MRFRAVAWGDFEWFSEKVEIYPTSQFSGILAEDEEGNRLGMIGLDYWTPRSVQAHVRIDDVICLAPLWREVVGYLQKHGRRLVIGVTPSNNELSLRLQKALRFEETHRLKDAWDDGVDIVITEYTIHGTEFSSTDPVV